MKTLIFIIAILMASSTHADTIDKFMEIQSYQSGAVNELVQNDIMIMDIVKKQSILSQNRYEFLCKIIAVNIFTMIGLLISNIALWRLRK